jgi:membrane fusion protein (multidrug efflux system)
MALEAQQQRDRDQHGPGEISPRPRGRGGSRWPVDDPRSAQAEDSPRARAPTPPERAPNKRRIVEVPPEREERPEQDRERGDAPGRGLLRRHPFAFVIGLVLFILAAAGGYLYWDYARHFESTDDAFVAARQFPIAPKVSGYITLVPVTDNQHVAAGDVIARIDDRDYRIALDQAQAQVASAEANIQNIDAQINVQQAQITANQAQVDQAQASLVFAQQQAKRYQDLAQTGSGTVQNAQQWTSQQQQQEAALASAQANLKVAATTRVGEGAARGRRRESRASKCPA